MKLLDILPLEKWIELEIEIGDVDGNAIPLHIPASRERILVQAEQAINTNLGCDDKRVPH